MNLTLTLRILGALLLCLAGTLLLPLPFSFYYGDGAWSAFIFSALTCLVIGGLLFHFCQDFHTAHFWATSDGATGENSA